MQQAYVCRRPTVVLPGVGEGKQKGEGGDNDDDDENGEIKERATKADDSQQLSFPA